MTTETMALQFVDGVILYPLFKKPDLAVDIYRFVRYFTPVVFSAKSCLTGFGKKKEWGRRFNLGG